MVLACLYPGNSNWLVAWKTNCFKKFNNQFPNFKIEQFDDLITYLIISIILGGRIGYILFYNLNYYLLNPLDMLKLWEGGMSFHGALIGIILGTYIFSIKRKLSPFFY